MSKAEGLLAADRARALALTPVSRETLARLDRFVELLLTWQKTTNLIAPSTVPHLWTRHVADSLQILEFAPEARVWIDLGSGGGFPGLAVACTLVGRPGAVVHLVESNAKKAAFLREAQRLTGAPVVVHAERIERFIQHCRGPVDVVMARALAPLSGLLALSFPLLDRKGVLGLFMKGRDAEAELRDAAKSWRMDVTLIPSRTDPHGRIVAVRGVAVAPTANAVGQTDKK
jgi:16S rRNA (guanine527-N7)-methyltransferase